MASEGKAVLFISHDLDEVMSACTALTVLRDGEHIADLDRAEFEAEKIKHLMVGRKIEGDYYRADFDGSFDSEPVLVMEEVSDGLLRDFSLTLHRGEILGICGLSESGIRNVGRLAFGIERPISGCVYLPGRGVAVENPKASIKQRLGYASKDRDTESLVLDDSVRNNLVVPVYDELRSHGFILGSAEKAYAQKQVDFLSIKCSSTEQLVQTLSGGNKQKVVFGRWLGADSDILILDCPTRGIDIGVKTVMYQLIHELKQQGKSILMISEELPELIGMCDRILVVKNGALSKEFRRSQALAERDIIEYMI
jgi:ribose transport system ATP-binding protein